MYRSILLHELRHWLRQPLPWLFAVVLFALSFITMWGTASEAAGGENAEILNSPFRLSFMSNYFSLLLLFLLPMVVGAALHRDYKSRMFTVLYSFPLTKRDYLGAKFTAAMLVVGAVVTTIGFGFALGAMMPGIKPEVVTSFSPSAYLQLYGTFLLPNLLLFGLLVFLIIIRTRNIYLAFIGVIVLVAGQAILGGLLQTESLKMVGALLDPTGSTAIKSVLRNWTLAERNTSLLPISGIILANRLLWWGATFGLGIACWRSFSFGQFARSAGRAKPGEATTTPPIGVLQNITPPAARPVVSLDYAWFSAIDNLTWHNFRYITFSYPFLALLLVGFLTVFLQQAQMNPEFGFELLPTTGNMLRIPMFIFGMTINLVTFLYVGVLSNRGNTTRMGDLVDASAVPNPVLLAGRLLAIFLVQLLLLTLVIVGGVLTQKLQGYHRVELWHYVLEVYGLQFIHFVIWACMATFIHTLLKNIYLGFFALLLVGSAFGALAELGNLLEWEILGDGIIQFNKTPRVFGGFAYSDWNGYGGVIGHYLAYKGYWLLGGCLLLGASLLLWNRGYVFSWRERGMQALGRRTGKAGLALSLLLLAFVGLGAALYHHDHHVAGFQISDAVVDATLARNEKLYGRYLSLPQPRIARANITVDLYPAQREYQAQGTLWFTNKLDQPLDTILVSRSFKDRTSYRINQPHQFISQDSLVHLDIIRLNTTLRKGDSLALHFTVRNAPNAPLWDNDRVLTNGTYLHGYHILPQLGVRETFLSGAKKRAKYGLEERVVRKLIPTDSTLLGHAFAGNNMDRIAYNTIVSTESDQQAFSMGNLQRKWTENDRNYFQYTSDGPIVNNISWLSGRYVNDVDLTAVLPVKYHTHASHQEGLADFREGVKAGLSLGSDLFGALAYDTISMVEFPISQGSHATLNGNLIPTSESYLLCDVDHENNEIFNVPFFVGAHEVAHYWWGHRVDPANVPGGRMITEGLADYLAIAAVGRTFGPAAKAGMLSKWRTLYFRGRAGRGNEVPLLTAGLEDNQDYLNYRKAALAFNGLAGYLGENHFHAALADFEAKYRFTTPPYPTSLDLVAALRAAAPDSLDYLIEDYFETITLYDNGISGASIEKTLDGKFKVTVDFFVSKYRADGKGAKSYDEQKIVARERASLPLSDYLYIECYTGSESLRRQMVKITTIDNQISFTLTRRPDRIVLDPDGLLLDSNEADGSWEFPFREL